MLLAEKIDRISSSSYEPVRPKASLSLHVVLGLLPLRNIEGKNNQAMPAKQGLGTS